MDPLDRDADEPQDGCRSWADQYVPNGPANILGLDFGELALEHL